MLVSHRWRDGPVRSRLPKKGARPVEPSRAPMEGCSARAALAPEDSAGADLRRRASPVSLDSSTAALLGENVQGLGANAVLDPMSAVEELWIEEDSN